MDLNGSGLEKRIIAMMTSNPGALEVPLIAMKRIDFTLSAIVYSFPGV